MRSWQFGATGVALVTASPGLASDFPGFGRVGWWAVIAIPVFIALIVTLLGHLRHPGSREVDAVLSGLAALLLAPALLIHIEGQWLPTLFPGLALAMFGGMPGLMFPVPFVSVMISWGLLFLGLEKLRARHTPGGEDGE